MLLWMCLPVKNRWSVPSCRHKELVRTMKSTLLLYISCTLLVFAVAAPARAQYQPRPVSEPATGESYHIEASAGLWFPGAEMTVTSAGSGALSGLAGTTIGAQTDLGMPDSKTLPFLTVTLRPAKNHKFRLNFVPMSFEGTATITRNIDFNGQRYRLGLPVTSTLDWTAARFGYEYDFLSKPTWFAGFILEAKYTDVNVNLTTAGPPAITEFDRARAPIPALGFIGRYYVVPNASISGEFTAFKLPTVQDRYSGHYFDYDFYATYNVIQYFGLQAGYRRLDFGYLAKEDSGSFVMKGIYLAAVVRY